MAFLDFIKNRNVPQQQSVADKPQPKPDPAKPLAPETQARADSHEQKMARAMRYMDASTRPKLPARSEIHAPRNPPSWER